MNPGQRVDHRLDALVGGAPERDHRQELIPRSAVHHLGERTTVDVQRAGERRDGLPTPLQQRRDHSHCHHGRESLELFARSIQQRRPRRQRTEGDQALAGSQRRIEVGGLPADQPAATAATHRQRARVPPGTAQSRQRDVKHNICIHVRVIMMCQERTQRRYKGILHKPPAYECQHNR